MPAIARHYLREISDNRYTPTIEVDVVPDSAAIEPRCRSLWRFYGAHEAVELRDGDDLFVTNPERLQRGAAMPSSRPAPADRPGDEPARREHPGRRDEMRHLEIAEIAKLLSDGGVFAEFCRHMAEVCPVCGERLAEVEALMERFRHWDAETVLREGPPAADLLDALLAAERASKFGPLWWNRKTRNSRPGSTWVALERAQDLIAVDATRVQARNLALLAATIAAHLGASYSLDSIADLKALAHATAAAAGPPGAAIDTLRQVAAAMAALDQGTGDPTVARDVLSLLAQIFRKAAE